MSNIGTQGMGSQATVSIPTHRSVAADAKKSQQLRITQARYNQASISAEKPTDDGDAPEFSV